MHTAAKTETDRCEGGGRLDGVTILRPETVRLMSTDQLSDTITERLWLPSKGQMGFGIDFAAVLFTRMMPFDRVQLHKRFRDAVYGPARLPPTAG